MTWRLARSLQVLREEFDRLAPARSRRLDGTIGDRAHQSRASRHNPNEHGVVTALDITDDPAAGCRVHEIARAHVHDPHPELAYVISNGQYASRNTGWRWRTYTGSNPHTAHAHWAVGVGPDSNPQPPYDSEQPWGIAQEDDDMLRRGDAGPRVLFVQARLNAWAGADLTLDGEYGPATEAAVETFQGRKDVGLRPDGVFREVDALALAELGFKRMSVGNGMSKLEATVTDLRGDFDNHGHGDTYVKRGSEVTLS